MTTISPVEPTNAQQPPAGPPTASSKGRAPRGFRKAMFAVGLLLLTVGLATMGWVGWQVYGTNMVARQHQEANLSAIEKAWADGNDTAKAKEGPLKAVLWIPRFGEDWRMPIIDSVSEEALAVGVGHFPKTAGPGEKGNFALAAHRVTHGEPFRDMPALQPGDKVIVETATHRYTYVLDTGGDDKRIPMTDTSVLADKPDGSKTNRVLTLTTCAELFHTDDRLVAFGHLVETERKRS